MISDWSIDCRHAENGINNKDITVLWYDPENFIAIIISIFVLYIIYNFSFYIGAPRTFNSYIVILPKKSVLLLNIILNFFRDATLGSLKL